MVWKNSGWTKNDETNAFVWIVGRLGFIKKEGAKNSDKRPLEIYWDKLLWRFYWSVKEE